MTGQSRAIDHIFLFPDTPTPHPHLLSSQCQHQGEPSSLGRSMSLTTDATGIHSRTILHYAGQSHTPQSLSIPGPCLLNASIGLQPLWQPNAPQLYLPSSPSLEMAFA